MEKHIGNHLKQNNNFKPWFFSLGYQTAYSKPSNLMKLKEWVRIRWLWLNFTHLALRKTSSSASKNNS